jgi:thioredoxin reductase (NADPH)
MTINSAATSWTAWVAATSAATATNRPFPVVDDPLVGGHRARPEHSTGVRVVGHRWSDRSHATRTFLARNHVPYRWYDVDSDTEGRRLCAVAGATLTDLPLVLGLRGETLRAPSTVELAGALGLHTSAHQALYDVCIVGGGPAGLAAAVYAASEGLSTVIVEREAPGGQADQSAAIENYLGFPRGLTGSDLTERAVAQAARFGAEVVLARDVVGLETRGPVHAVLLDRSEELDARAVVVATGVSYRCLDADGAADLTGRGVYYGATASEAAFCRGGDVYVVGAANSAGQAALNLARYAERVVLLVRGSALEASMSGYLRERIGAAPNIEVRLCHHVAACHGDGHLETVTLADSRSGELHDVPVNWLYVFIGGSPRTEWLAPRVLRYDPGFVVTGPDVRTAAHPEGWTLPREPLALETSVPGIFAAGDVRLDSMKRVASAVGDGALAGHLVHRYLQAT